MENNIYQILYDENLTHSMRDFSVNWCGRSHNYLSDCDALSESACLNIARRLWREDRRHLALHIFGILLSLDDENDNKPIPIQSKFT